MAVTEGEPAGVGVVRGRNVEQVPKIRSGGRIAGHIRKKISLVYGILALIQEQKNLRRAGVHQVGELCVDLHV